MSTSARDFERRPAPAVTGVTVSDEAVHWPDLDEDISVEGVLAGRPSGESQASLKRWLESRGAAA